MKLGMKRGGFNSFENINFTCWKCGGEGLYLNYNSDGTISGGNGCDLCDVREVNDDLITQFGAESARRHDVKWGPLKDEVTAEIEAQFPDLEPLKKSQEWWKLYRLKLLPWKLERMFLLSQS